MYWQTIIAIIFWFASSWLKDLIKVVEFQTDSLDFINFVFVHHGFILYLVEFTRSLQTNLLLKINSLPLIFVNLFVRYWFTVALCKSLFFNFQFNLSLYFDIFIPFNFTVNSLLATMKYLLHLQPSFIDMYFLICLFLASLNYAIVC